MEIKRLISKYLFIILGLLVLRVVFEELFPDLFVKTIIGDGFTQKKSTFFGIFQVNFFNIILGLIMAFDLKKIKQNLIVIPILTVVSATVGIFFFSILILNNQIENYERI